MAHLFPLIPSIMNGSTYGFASLATNMSGHSADIASNTSLDPGSFRQVPQMPPILDEDDGWTDSPLNSPSSEIPAYPDAKTFALDLYPSTDLTHSALLQVIIEGPETLYPESPVSSIHEESFTSPVARVCPLESLCQTTFIGFTNSSLQGYEGLWSVDSLIPSEDINPAAVDDRIHDRSQERASESTDVSLDYSHRLHAHTTPSSISAPSALPVISLGQTVVQNKAKRASRRERSHRFQNFQKTGKNLVTDLSESRTSLRPDKKLRNPQGRYSCSICKLDYAQPQGLTRHQVERHNARLCLYCREFTWGRRYLFKKHLEMRHPGIDHNAAINEATRTHRRGRYLPQQQLSIPTAEHDSQGSATRAESQARRPDMSSITYNPQPESTETAIKETHGHEDARPLELANANRNHAPSPSTEERAQIATNLDMSTRNVQIRFQDEKAVSAAADSQSTLAPALVSSPTLSVSRYSGSPDIVGPMIETSGHTYSFHPPPAFMLRSGQAFSPSSRIGCSWADIFPPWD